MINYFLRAGNPVRGGDLDDIEYEVYELGVDGSSELVVDLTPKPKKLAQRLLEYHETNHRGHGSDVSLYEEMQKSLDSADLENGVYIQRVQLKPKDLRKFIRHAKQARRELEAKVESGV